MRLDARGVPGWRSPERPDGFAGTVSNDRGARAASPAGGSGGRRDGSGDGPADG